MVAVPVYVEALPEREVVLHPKGAYIQLPPENDKYLPSMSKRAETKEESPPTLERVLMFEETS